MGNEKRINTISLENPLERAKGVKVDATALEKWIKTTQTNQKVILDPKQAKTNLEKAAQKNKPSLGPIPNNKTTAAAKGNAKECPNFCRKPGFHILPLRYSVAESAPALHKNLGKNVNNIALTKHKYTVEMVNTGYIYALVKRQSGPMRWSGYIINKQGFLSYFNPDKDKAPLSAPNFACQSGEHIMKAGLVTIEEIPNNQAKEVYLILTHAPMTKRKRDEYLKNADKFVSEGKWQKLGVANWRGGNTSQSHCFPISNVSTINKKEVYGKRLGNTQERFSKYGLAIACMAFYDPIGITRTLNDNRNIKSFGNIDSFLNKKENGTTNNHKLQTVNLIDNIEKAIKEKIIKIKFDRIDAPKNIAKGHFEHDSRIILTREQRAQISKNIEEKHEKSIDVFAQRTKAQIEAVVETEEGLKKYQQHLDMVKVSNFKSKIDELSANSYDKAITYQSDHYSWLVSNNLINALHCFDDNEKLVEGEVVDNSNGFLFHILVLDFMNGMRFLKKGDSLLDEWINSNKVDARNLFLRAYCYNNKRLIESYNSTFSNSEAGKTVLDYSKPIFGLFKSADDCFDQWLNLNQTKTFLNSSGFKSTDKMFYWMSLMLNSALMTFSDLKARTISISSIPIIAREATKTHVVGLFYLRSGDFAQHINLAQLMHNHDFRSAALESLPKSSGDKPFTYRNVSAQNISNVTQLSIKNKIETSKNRILAVVGVFELLNFYFQYDAWKADLKNKPELLVQLVAASLTTSSVMLEMLGERWSHSPVLIKDVNSLRTLAGSFGTVASFLSFYVDGKKFAESSSNTVKVIVALNISANAAFAIGQIGGMGSAVAKYTHNEVIKRSFLKFSETRMISFLMGTRVIFGLNLFVLSLFLLEAFLKKVFLDNALEDWCQKSSFRKSNSKEKQFKNESEEYEEFVKSIGSV